MDDLPQLPTADHAISVPHLSHIRPISANHHSSTVAAVPGQYCTDLACLCNETRGFRVALQVSMGCFPTNRARRFHMYQVAANRLGYQPRTKLPACVETLIKESFPDAAGQYTGYIPK